MVMAGQEKWATVAVSFFSFWLACQVYCVCAATSSKWLGQDTDSNADANMDRVRERKRHFTFIEALHDAGMTQKRKRFIAVSIKIHTWGDFLFKTCTQKTS